MVYRKALLFTRFTHGPFVFHHTMKKKSTAIDTEMQAVPKLKQFPNTSL